MELNQHDCHLSELNLDFQINHEGPAMEFMIQRLGIAA